MQRSGFSRNICSEVSLHAAGVKRVANNEALVSSGIADLDYILGGGISLGTLVMIMEDPEAPHHLLLIRNFMSQGIVHAQPLLFASPVKDPQAFLGTLPSPAMPKAEKREMRSNNYCEENKELRIAWQYMKYSCDRRVVENIRDNKSEYCHDFDLRKLLEKKTLSGCHIDCISIMGSSSLLSLHERCNKFLSQFPRKDSGGIENAARIALQSFCAPQCGFLGMDWEILSFIHSLKSMLRMSCAVAVISFPPSVLTFSLSRRLQHLADTIVSVRAILDEDKEMTELLTGYKDMVGLLRIHKVTRMNSQVPVILDTSTFSIKLQKRRCVALEKLNQAPVDDSGGTYDAWNHCESSKPSVDF